MIYGYDYIFSIPYTCQDCEATMRESTFWLECPCCGKDVLKNEPDTDGDL